AASLVTLASAGVDVKPQAQRLHAAATTLGTYPIDAKARVLALLAKQPRYARARATLLADVLGSVRETAAGATIVARFVEAERLLFGSNTKTTSLALDALIREVPDHAVIAKLARGVLDARAHGRWISTQENLVVLQAMRKYFDTYEKATPNYTGKLWFGAAAYAEQAFVGRSSARGRVTIDWPTLGLGKTHDLTLAKAGVGRMYYRVGITYAPRQAILPAMDAGFIVRRSYTGVDNPGDVTALPNGQLKVKLGARVLVQLEVLNTTRRNVVGLADPMPAGFEPVNTRLANAERAAAAVTDGWDYTNLRDERAEGFASSLPEGTHHYAYTVRATTPGVFVVAPAKAEEMYAPETFGRSASVTVTVE
ncbi:MAG: hypothetical protein NT062_09760, partial [Proteobacteria bacterium]|nr:hypothetical protein [Pseudomonadota bacterium]